MSADFCCIHSFNAAKHEAWRNRELGRCRCDHHEYCDVCYPLEFRPGGYWSQQEAMLRAAEPQDAGQEGGK